MTTPTTDTPAIAATPAHYTATTPPYYTPYHSSRGWCFRTPYGVSEGHFNREQCQHKADATRQQDADRAAAAEGPSTKAEGLTAQQAPGKKAPAKRVAVHTRGAGKSTTRPGKG